MGNNEFRQNKAFINEQFNKLRYIANIHKEKGHVTFWTELDL